MRWKSPNAARLRTQADSGRTLGEIRLPFRLRCHHGLLIPSFRIRNLRVLALRSGKRHSLGRMEAERSRRYLLLSWMPSILIGGEPGGTSRMSPRDFVSGDDLRCTRLREINKNCISDPDQSLNSF